MTHVRTSPYYPQSNGKLQRYHRTIKSECIRPGTPLTLDDARRLVSKYVVEYNEVRLHSALGYVTPIDKLRGREQAIFAERDRKLETAREQRRSRRRGETCYNRDAWTEDRALLASGHRPQVGPSADPGPEASAEGGPTSPSVSSHLLLA